MTQLQLQVHKTITKKGKAGWNMFKHPAFKGLLILDYKVSRYKDEKAKLI
jgi:hypothetical protein